MSSIAHALLASHVLIHAFCTTPAAAKTAGADHPFLPIAFFYLYAVLHTATVRAWGKLKVATSLEILVLAPVIIRDTFEMQYSGYAHFTRDLSLPNQRVYTIPLDIS